MKNKIDIEKKIIIAPLNWGLGHATRCIPIINALIDQGFEPVICSDGVALLLLQKEFPKLKSYELPSYDIQYTKNGNLLKYRLLLDSLKIIKAVKKEKQLIDEIVKKENIKGIISDNRFGVRSNKIPSVYLTHQINVLSGSTSFLTSKLHQKIIAKFDECWIPDYKTEPNLSGKLSHIKDTDLRLKYINPLSRFNYIKSDKEKEYKYDLAILLSGPEPQRTILEKKLISELKYFHKNVLFISGVISNKQEFVKKNNIVFVNFMLKNELQNTINDSEIILTRSGYSTIMDLEKLNKKTFFIPTPGQFEQEYLAKNLEQFKIAPFASQKDFKISMLSSIKNYTGFINKKTSNTVDFVTLFDVFN
ncbi:MAG: glycosyltransferase [Bacteroidota bacterium]